MTRNTVLIGAAVCSSLAVGYLLGKLHGSRRYADDYIQRPGREYKKTAGLKTFLEYVAKYSSAEHHTVTELRRVICEKLEEFSPKATEADQTSFITQLAKAIGARKVLEVGTFAGTTSLSIALVLPEDGQMVTIDFKEDWVSTGRPIWEKAGVSHKIRSIIKDAAQALDELLVNGEIGTFDMVYIDADKWNYPVYYDKCMQLVRKGGIILLDDTLWEGYVCDPKINKDGKTSEVEPLDYQRDSIELYKYHLPSIYKRIAVHMHALNKKIVKDPRALVNILPVGSGLTIVTKL
ncbi:probable caffeoyl-CoA O-methyltransferase 1 [Pocillopora verrucosa]|uniref:probable caffeoyl-CoA O-methyltransferase 1 n=1 Tax=Pocillopora verrucosa TaxID=203993 RepID=UPI003341F2BD